MHSNNKDLFSFNKEMIQERFKELFKQDHSLNRDSFLKKSGFSKRLINKLFGSFTNLKNQSLNNDIITEVNTYDSNKVEIKANSLDEVLDKCNIDLNVWDVDYFNTKELSSGGFSWTVYFKRKKISEANFEKLLENWTPPKFEIDTKLNKKSGDSNTLLTSLNDTHICELTTKNMVFSEKEYNTEIAINNVRSYLNKIIEKVNVRKFPFNKGVLFLGGDIVHSTLDEFTRRGTKLHCEYVNEQAFRIVLDLLVEFIGNFSKLFNVTEVVSVKGNHCSVLGTYLVLAAQRFFWSQKNIKFTIFDNWINHYRINNIFCIFTHGVSDTIKGIGLPGNSTKFKSYIQELLIQNPQSLLECKERIIVTAHKHSQYIEDFGSFKVYRFGSTVNADSFGEGLGFFNRPQQSCLVLSRDSVEEIWNFYLD